MILLNFAHPLTGDQREQLAALSYPVDEVRDIPTQLDLAAPLVAQVKALVDSAGLTPEQCGTSGILVILPSLNFAAVAVLAELRHRIGYYPPIVRLRPVTGALPPRYEVAEVMDLNRSLARSTTWGYPPCPEVGLLFYAPLPPLPPPLTISDDQAAIVQQIALRLVGQVGEEGTEEEESADG